MDPDSLKYWVVSDDPTPVLTAVTYIQPRTSDQRVILYGLAWILSVGPQVHQLVGGLLSVSMLPLTSVPLLPQGLRN